VRLHKSSDIKSKNGIEYVKKDEEGHQHQDGVSSSGFWGAFVV
jgi:hypothetical protein